MEKQIINNGQVVLEKENLILIRNPNGNQLVFHVVDIDHGYVVMEPLDLNRTFAGDQTRLNEFLANRIVAKGVVSTIKK